MNPVIFPIKDSGQKIRKNKSFDYGSAGLCSMSIVARRRGVGENHPDKY